MASQSEKDLESPVVLLKTFADRDLPVGLPDAGGAVKPSGVPI
jgi:hypothetical protein